MGPFEGTCLHVPAFWFVAKAHDRGFSLAFSSAFAISLVAALRKNLGTIWELTNVFCPLHNAHELGLATNIDLKGERCRLAPIAALAICYLRKLSRIDVPSSVFWFAQIEKGSRIDPNVPDRPRLDY
jgi:hypothetical protein